MAIDVRFGSPALPGTFTVTTPTPERPARKLLLPPPLPHTEHLPPTGPPPVASSHRGTDAGIGTASPWACSHRPPGFVSTPMSSLLGGRPRRDDLARLVTRLPPDFPDLSHAKGVIARMLVDVAAMWGLGARIGVCGTRGRVSAADGLLTGFVNGIHSLCVE